MHIFSIRTVDFFVLFPSINYTAKPVRDCIAAFAFCMAQKSGRFSTAVGFPSEKSHAKHPFFMAVSGQFHWYD
jgi:hypothetical protein